MKKIISVLMCALIMFSLVSCGGTGGSVEISRGSVIGNIYTNDFADFTFTKPSGWDYLTDEEISETINIGQDALDLNVIQEALAEKATIYDMVAMDPAHGNSVMVCYENTRLTAGHSISADEYTEILKNQLQDVGGYDYEFISSEDATLSGSTFKKGLFKANPYSTDLYQAYYVKAIDNYIVTIIVTATTESIEDIEAMFDADAENSTDFIPRPTLTTEEETEAENKEQISRGTINGDDYINSFGGFAFTKPSSWVYLTDEEIGETINIGQDLLDLSSIEKALAEKSSLYDMAASDPEYGNSVMVCYENTKITISEDDYAERLKNQILNSGVYNYEFISSEDSTLSGTAFKKVLFKAYPEGVEINQAYYIRAIDSYIVAIIVTATTESIDSIEAMFN